MQLIPREIYSSLVSQFTRASQTCISTSNHQDRTCLREIHGDKWCQARIALVPIKWARILAISVIPIRLFSIGLWLTFSFCHFLIGYKHCQPEKYRNRNSPLIFSKYSIPCEALIDTATMSSSHRPKQMYGHSPLVKKMSRHRHLSFYTILLSWITFTVSKTDDAFSKGMHTEAFYAWIYFEAYAHLKPLPNSKHIHSAFSLQDSFQRSNR